MLGIVVVLVGTTSLALTWLLVRIILHRTVCSKLRLYNVSQPTVSRIVAEHRQIRSTHDARP